MQKNCVFTKGANLAPKNTTLDDIAAVIGFSAAIRLSAWYGDGNNVYIPAEVSENSALSRLLGFSAAKALSREWPSESLAVPRLTEYEQSAQKRMILRMVEKQFGTREIAMHIRMSERRVQQIVRELEAAGFLEPIAPGKMPKEILLESAPPKAPGKSAQENAPGKPPRKSA